ncbi:uncharacterized protein RSE6_05549 [Rhynchosporium secalis]|uniref:Uncharacterized protein n=1 Tax=Rhynchosporium secalis TaxID=38038 RepID=A0A1E1M9A4_RHYSE|nr:uncharacterized protein RSE6_05549 [Rhynchosporium secalis]
MFIPGLFRKSYKKLQAFGLPCFHTLWKRQQEGGSVLLSDIHHHWYYNRPDSVYSAPPVPLSLLNPLKVKGKGRPKGALGGRVAPSNTRREPLLFELPSSSAPASLGQHFTVQNSVSSTSIAIQRLKDGHLDSYEPGTRRERGYMYSMASIYHSDSIVDATTASEAMIQRDVIGGIEVYTQDAEFEEDLDELA